MNSPVVSAKPELRRVYRARRNALQGKQREKMDFDLNQRLLEQASGWGDGSILAFWPNDGEPDLRVALTQLSESGTTIGLPVLERENGKSMSFRQWFPGQAMTPNWFGIPEPRDGRSCWNASGHGWRLL
jgi:5,10-methenyltetrahydrofolate synthetase